MKVNILAFGVAKDILKGNHLTIDFEGKYFAGFEERIRNSISTP
jgi:hypothetical protein